MTERTYLLDSHRLFGLDIDSLVHGTEAASSKSL